jgi:glycosyltransferase involved in cell wall biosynthesis
MATIDISVIIPTFRRPALLVEAISSVLGQEGVNTEIIVIDDSPEGSALEAVKGCDDERVRYMRCDPPSGGKPAHVRNLGWRKAAGRIVHFLDDDDRAGDGFYRAAIDLFDRNPRTGVVFGHIQPFSSQDDTAMEHERRYFADASRRARLASTLGSRYWLVANLLFRQTLLVNSACLIRRECIAELNGYDTELGLNEDVDFYCRAIRRFGFEFLDRVAVNYRILPDSLMHGRCDDRRLVESYKRMYARYRASHGVMELLALKLFARTVLRVV